MASILSLQFSSSSGWRNHVHPIQLEVAIESIAGIGAIANEMLGLSLQHVEVEAELHQRDLMMIRRVRADRQREPMPIDDREDLDAFAPAGGTDAGAAPLGQGKRRIDEALAFVDRPFLAQGIRQLRETLPQHFAFAPLLEVAMHRLVMGRALLQQVPLRAGVENPEHGLQQWPAPVRACAPGGAPGCAPRENGPESVPIGHRITAACGRIIETLFNSTTILR